MAYAKTKSKKDLAQKEQKQFTLRGTVYWTHLNKPSKESGKYQTTIEISDADAEKVDLMGVPLYENRQGDSVLKIGKNEDGTDNVKEGNFVVLKSAFRPEAVDAKGRDLPEGLEVGNGTKAVLATHVYDWVDPKGRAGKSLGFDAIQVLDLVKYERRSARDLFAQEEGYEVDSAFEQSSEEVDGSTDEETQDAPTSTVKSKKTSSKANPY